MPSTRKNLKQVIADLEERNSLSKQDADALRTAPQWSLTGAEITGYLGGGIIAVGIAWIIIAFAQDLHQLTISLALYVVGAVTLASARWLWSRGIRSGQVAEVLFGVGIGSLAGAIGLTLNYLGTRDSVAAVVACTLAIIVGLAICRRTSFVGTLIVAVAAQPLIFSISETFHLSDRTSPLLIVLSGALLVVLGVQRVGTAFVARFFGSVSIVIGSFVFAVMRDSSFRPIVSIAICAVLFYIGARRINIELIVGGGVGITIAIGILAERIFDSFVMQGAIVTATGAAISALSLVIVRRSEARTP